MKNNYIENENALVRENNARKISSTENALNKQKLENPTHTSHQTHNHLFKREILDDNDHFTHNDDNIKISKQHFDLEKIELKNIKKRIISLPERINDNFEYISKLYPDDEIPLEFLEFAFRGLFFCFKKNRKPFISNKNYWKE